MIEEKCTCGSGAHPRRCKKHPDAYEKHCEELNAEWQKEDEEKTKCDTL